MKLYLILLVLFGAISCGAPAGAAKTDDHANLQGTWLAQTESQNGNKRDVSYQYIFREDKITFIDETGKEMKYSFRLDTAAKPKLLIIQPEDTLTDRTPVSVAYELAGDSLKIVVAPAGLHPADISDRNNQELIICRRKGL